MFETDGIDNTKLSNQAYLNSTNNSQVDFAVYVSLRDCEVGESFGDDGKCTECASGTQYSLV